MGETKEKKELVKYNNELNQIEFRGFVENDFNFFMAICARMKELGEETQVIDYDYIMDLVQWDRRQSVDLFHSELKRMCDKLRHVGATGDTNPDEFVSFDLFPTFRGNKKKRTLTVKVNEDFKYILNDFTQFTQFELKEYVKLEGKYTKLLYQHLKQFKITGWWQVSLDEFRRVITVPETYQNKHIMDKIIKPSLPILRSCKNFSDLEVTILRSGRRGREIKAFLFRFTPEKGIRGQMNLVDIYDMTTQGQEEVEAPRSNSKKRPSKKNSFNNFEQRQYDFDELERQLLKK